MAMPEATVDEDDGFVFLQNDVRANEATPHPGPLPDRGGEGDGNADVQAEPVAHAMEQ